MSLHEYAPTAADADHRGEHATGLGLGGISNSIIVGGSGSLGPMSVSGMGGGVGGGRVEQQPQQQPPDAAGALLFTFCPRDNRRSYTTPWKLSTVVVR